MKRNVSVVLTTSINAMILKCAPTLHDCMPVTQNGMQPGGIDFIMYIVVLPLSSRLLHLNSYQRKVVLQKISPTYKGKLISCEHYITQIL